LTCILVNYINKGKGWYKYFEEIDFSEFLIGAFEEKIKLGVEYGEVIYENILYIMTRITNYERMVLQQWWGKNKFEKLILEKKIEDENIINKDEFETFQKKSYCSKLVNLEIITKIYLLLESVNLDRINKYTSYCMVNILCQISLVGSFVTPGENNIFKMLVK
jgi:hypothetical protein